MAGQWKEPAAEDVKKFMSSVVIDRADTAGEQVAGLLGIVVQRVRGAVGRINTLSDNDNEVPPEGLQHTLVLTVFQLLCATPNFGFLMKGTDGSETGFGYSVRVAEKWLDQVQRGMSVTYPINPRIEEPNVRWGSETEVDTTSA